MLKVSALEIFCYSGAVLLILVIAFLIWYFSERKRWDKEMREQKRKAQGLDNDIRHHTIL